MHNDAQSPLVIPHITEGLVDLARRSIGGFQMDPAHGIGGVPEALDDENFRLTFHPGAPIGSRGSNGKAGVAKGGIVPDEIRDSTTAGVAEGDVPLAQVGLKATGPNW